MGLSDPVFMATQNAQSLFQVPPFPYDPAANDKLFFDGDDTMRHQVTLAREWGKQVMSGVFRKWEDLKFLRENWDGPLVLKGIHCREVQVNSTLFLPFIQLPRTGRRISICLRSRWHSSIQSWEISFSAIPDFCLILLL